MGRKRIVELANEGTCEKIIAIEYINYLYTKRKFYKDIISNKDEMSKFEYNYDTVYGIAKEIYINKCETGLMIHLFSNPMNIDGLNETILSIIDIDVNHAITNCLNMTHEDPKYQLTLFPQGNEYIVNYLIKNKMEKC